MSDGIENWDHASHVRNREYRVKSLALLAMMIAYRGHGYKYVGQRKTTVLMVSAVAPSVASNPGPKLSLLDLHDTS